jgi:uncharacterized membrane protein YfcA
MDLTWIIVVGAFITASFIKGTTGMGFPLIATPMVALVVDLKTTYALLLLPNILMDVLQIGRHELPWTLWRRLATFLGTTSVGVFLGLRIFLSVSERFIFLAMAAMIVLYLISVRLRFAPRFSPRQEVWLGPCVGLLGGVLTGITNVIGPLVVIYVLGLGLSKGEIVKGLASIFLAAKASQLLIMSQWGLYTPRLFLVSAAMTAVALAAFWVGLHTQDRVPQVTFLRIVYGLLLVMACIFTVRGL